MENDVKIQNMKNRDGQDGYIARVQPSFYIIFDKNVKTNSYRNTSSVRHSDYRVTLSFLKNLFLAEIEFFAFNIVNLLTYHVYSHSAKLLIIFSPVSQSFLKRVTSSCDSIGKGIFAFSLTNTCINEQRTLFEEFLVFLEIIISLLCI